MRRRKSLHASWPPCIRPRPRTRTAPMPATRARDQRERGRRSGDERPELAPSTRAEVPGRPRAWGLTRSAGGSPGAGCDGSDDPLTSVQMPPAATSLVPTRRDPACLAPDRPGTIASARLRCGSAWRAGHPGRRAMASASDAASAIGGRCTIDPSAATTRMSKPARVEQIAKRDESPRDSSSMSKSSAPITVTPATASTDRAGLRAIVRQASPQAVIGRRARGTSRREEGPRIRRGPPECPEAPRPQSTGARSTA